MLRLLVPICSAALLAPPAQAQPHCDRQIVFRTVLPGRSPMRIPNQKPKRLDPDLSPQEFLRLYGTEFAPAGRLSATGRGEYAVTGIGELGEPPYCLGVGLGFTGGGNEGQSQHGALYHIVTTGHRVSDWGGCGPNRESFGTAIAQWLAGKGGICTLLARYEQTPVKATGELRARCALPGQTVSFDLNELAPGVERLGASEARPRLVVRAEDGSIDNREKGATPDEKVFAIDRQAADTSVRLEYRAPTQRKRAFDVLEVFNSCDVAAPSYTPWAATQRKDRIARFEVPLCDTYRLEYQYDAKTRTGGAALDIKVRGAVPFSITDRSGTTQYDKAGRPRNLRLDLKGEATLTTTMTGTEGECTITSTQPFKVKLAGQARYTTDWFLFIELTEDHSAAPKMTLKCPEMDPVTFSKPLPAVPIEYKTVELRDKEGASVEGPYQGAGGSGTYKLILHTSSGG